MQTQRLCRRGRACWRSSRRPDPYVGAPGRQVLEIVERARLRTGRRAREQAHESRRRVAIILSRCRAAGLRGSGAAARGTARSTGRIVTTEPAIISSLSCTCSRESAGERDRRGLPCLIAQHDQRPHEIVPAGEEREDRERHDDRFQQRQHDRAKMRHSPAPSMRAASSRSSGIERAYWRTRKMPNTVAIAGTITPP